MRKLSVFNNISLDGYFTDQTGDMSGLTLRIQNGMHSSRRTQPVAANSFFRRTTYEQMLSFWPTPQAAKITPAVARNDERSRRPRFRVHNTGSSKAILTR